MTSFKMRILHAFLATVVGAGALIVSDGSPVRSGLHLTQAYAIIGRPLTPMSYAGVARRSTARAYGAGVYAAPVVVAPACRQIVDVYGRVITQCY
jgi:hypothetical protein